VNGFVAVLARSVVFVFTARLLVGALILKNHVFQDINIYTELLKPHRFISSVAAVHQIPLNGADLGQRVHFDGTSTPLAQHFLLRVPLKQALNNFQSILTIKKYRPKSAPWSAGCAKSAEHSSRAARRPTGQRQSRALWRAAAQVATRTNWVFAQICAPVSARLAGIL